MMWYDDIWCGPNELYIYMYIYLLIFILSWCELLEAKSLCVIFVFTALASLQMINHLWINRSHYMLLKKKTNIYSRLPECTDYQNVCDYNAWLPVLIVHHLWIIPDSLGLNSPLHPGRHEAPTIPENHPDPPFLSTWWTTLSSHSYNFNRLPNLEPTNDLERWRYRTVGLVNHWHVIVWILALQWLIWFF